MKTRSTIQRMKILQYLQSTKEHPSAEMVYAAVVRELPTITLATVYRNLNLLAEEGTINRLKTEKAYRYDAQEGTHTHGICTTCGVIIDLLPAKKALPTFNNFYPEEIIIIYKGLCAACKAQEK
jgi:Fur family peroxide stress response transcriptional regulator